MSLLELLLWAIGGVAALMVVLTAWSVFGKKRP
jgi:hypothetical protein